jgi:hypothetical protein
VLLRATAVLPVRARSVESPAAAGRVAAVPRPQPSNALAGPLPGIATTAATVRTLTRQILDDHGPRRRAPGNLTRES